jgi:hypothetical protein
MTKKQLLEELQHFTYTRLGVSKYAGVGVFCIKKIFKGTDPFKCSRPCSWIKIKPEELVSLDFQVKSMVEDFAPMEDGYWWLPSFGLNQIDPSFYLSHSKTPNMIAEKLGERFIASRDIEVGEELTVDYDTYSEDDHNYEGMHT